MTDLRLNYKSDDLHGNHELIYGDGDGTVNERSLKGCKYWRGKQRQSVMNSEITNAEHTKIISHEQTLSYIVNVLVKNN